MKRANGCAQGVALHFRLSADESARLAKIEKRLPTFSRASVARAAILLGIAAIERDPAALLAAVTEAPAAVSA